jgi:uncharacterized Zn finger protein
MMVTDFEEYVDDTIVGRGRDYFRKGKVENIKKLITIQTN